jgi:cytochrome c oxidase cbb3-type subunit 3
MSERDLVKPHSFDGIQEYDNDLPRWWMALLVLSVLWAAAYVAYYSVWGGAIGPDLLAQELAAVNEERARTATGPLPEALLRELSHDPARFARGKALFTSSQCVTCHGPDATGLVGPNLRDDWWLYGSDMTTLVETITLGRANGAMPAQGRNLSANDITDLACFVAQQNRSAKSGGKPHDPARDKLQPITW